MWDNISPSLLQATADNGDFLLPPLLLFSGENYASGVDTVSRNYDPLFFLPPYPSTAEKHGYRNRTRGP